ncbi:MAG: hypothetical protein WAU42_14775 [Solirubrobacteraceae bacterium]
MALSGPRLRLYIDGTDAAADELREIGERARDAKPVLRVIQGLMAKAAREQFESEGERGGLKWEPDSPRWIERKLYHHWAADTEHRTGDLAASLMAATSGGNAIRRLSKQSTTYGTRLFYAQFQGHKRQLLRVTLHDADDWAERMVDWILSGKV